MLLKALRSLFAFDEDNSRLWLLYFVFSGRWAVQSEWDWNSYRGYVQMSHQWFDVAIIAAEDAGRDEDGYIISIRIDQVADFEVGYIEREEIDALVLRL